jgi:hypothetical protein
MHLGSIELLYINAQPLHQVKIIKRKRKEGYARCFPYSREGELVLGKLRIGCPPNAPCSRPVLEPMWNVMHDY